MRSEIFTEALRLYRMYSITFANALSIAWIKYKSDKLADKANLASELCMYYELERVNKVLLPLWKKRTSQLNSLRPRAVFVPNIEAYYGSGHYNAD